MPGLSGLSGLSGMTTCAGASHQNEIKQLSYSQVPTGGAYNLTLDGVESDFISGEADATVIQAALESIPSIGSGNVAVIGSAATHFTITFQGDIANTNISQLQVSNSSLLVGAPTVTVQTMTPGVADTHEQQHITINATGGTWSVAGVEALAWDTSGGNVEGDIEAATAEGVSVGLPLYTITWDDADAHDLLSVSSINLTLEANNTLVEILAPGDEFTQEVQKLSLLDHPIAGTWRINSGNPLAWNASAGAVEEELESHLAQGVSVTAIPGSWWIVTWDDVGDQSTLSISSIDLLQAGSVSNERITGGVPGTSEVQRLTLSDSPDGGTWRPGGVTEVASNASAGDVETAIETDLSQGVTVTGSGPYVVTWDATGNQATLSPDGGGLTRSVTATVTTIQQGS